MLTQSSQELAAAALEEGAEEEEPPAAVGAAVVVAVAVAELKFDVDFLCRTRARVWQIFCFSRLSNRGERLGAQAHLLARWISFQREIVGSRVRDLPTFSPP